MKRLIKWIVILFILLVAVLVAAPFFIPLDTVKKIASEKVKEITGRDLVIAGDIKASMWPDIGVTLKQVTLSNPEGYSDKYMAEIGDLTVEVALMPLLHGDVQIKQFVINKPVIHLEVNKKNVGNWQFAQKPENNDAAANSEAPKKSGGAVPVLGKIKINDGDFTYRDMNSGKLYNAGNVNLDIKMPSPESALDIIAKLTLNKEPVDITLHAEQPLKFMNEKSGDSPVKANIKIGSLLALAFEGKGNTQGASGNVDLNAGSLIALSSWAGKKMDWKGDTKLSLAIKGALSCTTSQCSFTKANISLDDANLSGDAKINFAGLVPALDAKLASDKIDLNHYLPKPDKQAWIEFISNAQAAANGWDTKPIDFSGLKAANANIALDVKEILYQSTTLSKVALNLKLANGALNLDIPHVELYNGSAKIAATANSSGTISASLDANNVQVEPLLKDFAQFDRLTGTANFNTSISGHGNSQSAIISSLNGKGEIKVSDGTIRGVNIAQVVSSAKAMVTGVDTSSEKTQFSELGGTYIITSGIVKNDDLIMKAPLLRLKGAGTVDLPNRYVKYLLTPTVVATLQGQGGKDKTGLDIPVMVEGNFEKLKFTPDLASVANDALKNPEKIKDTVKTLKESVKKPEDIKNLLKGFR